MSEHTTTATPDAARKDTGSQTRQKGAQILIENVTKRYGSGKAAVSLCGGGGQGEALLLSR